MRGLLFPSVCVKMGTDFLPLRRPRGVKERAVPRGWVGLQSASFWGISLALAQPPPSFRPPELTLPTRLSCG